MTMPVFDNWLRSDTPSALAAAIAKCSALKSVTFVGACDVRAVSDTRSGIRKILPEWPRDKLEVEA